MRLLFISALGIGLFLSACKGKNKGTTITSDDGKSSITVDTKNMAAASEEYQKKAEELKKLPPLSMDQLKSVLPEELAGIKRTNFNASSMMGYAVGTAEYKKDDSTELRLTVSDCAGEAGSAIYGLQFLGFNMQSESDDGYTKTVDFAGGRAYEKYEKGNNSYDLTYFTGDRFLVNIQGRNTGLEMVKQAANSLDFSKVK